MMGETPPQADMDQLIHILTEGSTCNSQSPPLDDYEPAIMFHCGRPKGHVGDHHILITWPQEGT